MCSRCDSHSSPVDPEAKPVYTIDGGRVRLPIPEGELLPAEERLQKVLKAIEDRMRSEQIRLKFGYDFTPEQEEGHRSFIQGLDIAWSLAKTESLRRTDSP